MDEMKFTLNSPLTEEQWDTITDVDFDHTSVIWFKTKHGKEVKFVKCETDGWIPCSERLPAKSGLYFVTGGLHGTEVCSRYYNIRADKSFWSGHPNDKVIAWMPLPEPWGGAKK